MVRAGAALALLVAAPLAARGLYVLPAEFFVSPGQRVTVAFQGGEAFPVSAAPAPARLLDAALHTASGVYNVVSLRPEGNVVTGQASVKSPGNAIISARTPPDFVEREAGRFNEYLRDQGLDDVLAWRKAKGEDSRSGRERTSGFAKSILVVAAPDGFYNHRVGLALEIVPEKDPYRLKVGESLPLIVLLEGQPAPRLQVGVVNASASRMVARAAGRTDAQGRIAVPISGAGKWRVATVAMRRCTDAKAADWESFQTSLTFEIR